MEKKIDYLDFNSLHTTPNLIKIVNGIQLFYDKMQTTSNIFVNSYSQLDQKNFSSVEQQRLRNQEYAEQIRNIQDMSYAHTQNSPLSISFENDFAKLNPVQIFIILLKYQNYLNTFLKTYQIKSKKINQIQQYVKNKLI